MLSAPKRASAKTLTLCEEYMTRKQRNIFLILALAIICGITLILGPASARGRWRFHIPNFPSSDGAPKWVDLELSDGNVILLGTDKPTADIGTVVGNYSNTGFGKYQYTDMSLTGTFRPGWIRASITVDESPGYPRIKLNRIFRKNIESTQQSGPGCPPQGVGSPEP